MPVPGVDRATPVNAVAAVVVHGIVKEGAVPPKHEMTRKPDTITDVSLAG